MANQVIAMMGLPRSGKSTVTKRLAARLGAPIVERDAIRLALHGQRYFAPAEPLIKGLDLLFIQSLFNAGHSVVIVDETNYSRQARDHIRLGGTWTTRFYEVDTSAETCIERARLTDQKDLIPVIQSMAARYEPLGSDEERYAEP